MSIARLAGFRLPEAALKVLVTRLPSDIIDTFTIFTHRYFTYFQIFIVLLKLVLLLPFLTRDRNEHWLTCLDGRMTIITLQNFIWKLKTSIDHLKWLRNAERKLKLSDNNWTTISKLDTVILHFYLIFILIN